MNVTISYDNKEDDDWELLTSIPLEKHPDLAGLEVCSKNLEPLKVYLCLYDYNFELPNGDILNFSASYNDENKAVWLMISENGGHKASVEAVKNDARLIEPCLIYTTSSGFGIRLAFKGE